MILCLVTVGLHLSSVFSLLTILRPCQEPSRFPQGSGPSVPLPVFGVLSQWFLARGRELVPLSLSVWHGLLVSGPSEASNTGERVVVAQFPGLVLSQEAMALATVWSIFKMEHLPTAPG